MKNTNAIGLDENGANSLSKKLNELLANYSIFYQNCRGYHWNIKGERFFELHLKFEELYTDILLKIDEIAERILTLGGIPEHNYSEYRKASVIKESKHISNGTDAVEDILSSIKTVISLQREIMSKAQKLGDEGTSSIMSDYIRVQEKLVWMYSAFLSK